MPAVTQCHALPKLRLPAARIIAGGIISTIPALFLLLDSVMHVMKPAPVVEAFAHLGYPLSLATPLGIIALVCLVIYVIPRTSILGAVLMTGYLGGAVSTHLRVGDPLFNVLFPVGVAALAWGGLYLRDGRLRILLEA